MMPRVVWTLCWLGCCVILPAQPPTTADYSALREAMVRDDLVGQGITNKRVLQAFAEVPRHEFTPAKYRHQAYLDMAIPIGESQTISAPFVVAYMTEQLDPQPTDKVLEIGTGSGFQAAILSPLVKEVYTIEIVEPLGLGAKRVLEKQGFKNVHVRIGDGFQGWAEHAPFDKIIVTCSPEKIPTPLVEQLKDGGRMIVPMGERYQQALYLVKKENGKLQPGLLRPTLFVPMTGKAEQLREVKPDPTKPRLINGGFEEIAGESREPTAWYYQRQMTLITNEAAPEGKHFVRFNNDTAGRQSRMLQGLGLDGRKVHKVELSCRYRAEDVRVGADRNQLPMVILLFFDENRTQVGMNWLGPFRGTQDWTVEKQRFDVPPQTREAIVNVGLFGGVGRIDFDAVDLRALQPGEK